MTPAGDLSKSRIDWAHISERDFNQLVEVLLIKMHATPPYRVDVIRGAGGDTGIDVVVWLEGRAVRIYQLKYFPEGFTGAFRKVRRPQVKDSFDTAWKNHAPSEWILVMPPDPHINERNYVAELAEGKQVDVEIWGQEKLAAALTDYPEVERAFTRDDLMETLKAIHQEKAGLIGGTDLSERIADLVSLANTRSQYWDVKVTAESGKVFEEYIPKHPDAMLKEPIETRVTFRFGREHQDEAARLRDGLEYGLIDDLDLPGDTAVFSRSGPSWVRPMPEMPAERLRMSPVATASDLDGKLITFSFLDKSGFTKGRFEGTITKRVKGSLGATIRASFANLVILTMKIPFNRNSGIPRLTMKFNAAGAPVRDVHVAMEMVRNFMPKRRLDVYAEGLQGSLELANLVQPLDVDAWTEMLVDDLFVIEKHLGPGISFVVPDSTEPHDRVNIRVARLLLEGYQTVMAPGQSMSVALNGELDEGLKVLLLEGGALFATQPAMPFEFQGAKYNLGAGAIYHPHVQAREGAEIFAALEAGTAAGRVVHLKPVDDTPFRVWLHPRGKVKPDQKPPYKPWGIPTIDDPVLPLEAEADT